MNTIEQEIKEAKNGLFIWNELQANYSILVEDQIICFPTKNKELNKETLQQIEEYMIAKYLKRLLIIVYDEVEIEALNENIEIVKISKDKMDCFIRYIKLVDCSNQIIVISDEMPFGNLCLVEKGGITLKEYIANSYLWRTNATNM